MVEGHHIHGGGGTSKPPPKPGAGKHDRPWRKSAAAVKEEISTFIDTYAKSHPNVRSKARIRYLELDDPFARPAGSLDVKDLQPALGTGDAEDGPEDGESWLTSSF